MIKDLKLKAENATQKFYIEHPKMKHFYDYLIGVDGCEEEPFVIANMNRNMDNWKNDLQYIAASSPQNILKLITALETAIEALEYADYHYSHLDYLDSTFKTALTKIESLINKKEEGNKNE